MEMTLGTWKQRYFVLKDSCLSYYVRSRPKPNNPNHAILKR
jgi:hypothetical protein